MIKKLLGIFMSKKKSSKTVAASRKKKKTASKKPIKKSLKKIKITSKKSAKKKKTVPVAGVVTHYFPKVNAAVVLLKRPLALGDRIVVRGKSGEFKQTITSMQIDRAPISQAKKGQEIGLEVKKKVHENDVIVLV